PSETGPFSAAGFHYVIPLAAPGEARYTTTNQSWGTYDGNDVCDAIVRAIQAGGMGFPPGGQVYVYLDIESNFALTDAYWRGFSGAVFQYVTPWSTQPFFPGVYANGCRTCHPNNAITADVLTAYQSPGLYFCYGQWASVPTAQSCNDCMNSPLPTFSAALPLTNLSGSYRVTLHHWQHGIDGTHRPNVPSGCQVC